MDIKTYRLMIGNNLMEFEAVDIDLYITNNDTLNLIIQTFTRFGYLLSPNYTKLSFPEIQGFILYERGYECWVQIKTDKDLRKEQNNGIQ